MIGIDLSTRSKYLVHPTILFCFILQFYGAFSIIDLFNGLSQEVDKSVSKNAYFVGDASENWVDFSEELQQE